MTVGAAHHCANAPASSTSHDLPLPLHPLSHLPIAASIGLRHTHYHALSDAPHPRISWLEVHPENFFGGGYHRHILRNIAEHTPLSFHCIGLSLGASDPVNTEHLNALRELSDEMQPAIISDHISWSKSGNAHMPDLLPLPYTEETLATLCRNIDQVQNALGRQILVENPSTYLTYAQSNIEEAAFVRLLSEQSGCGILLDINNIYVQAHNNGLDTHAYIDAMNPDHIGEIHLAGHIEESHGTGDAHLLIDTHSRHVAPPVWELYAYALERFGKVPTLIEWDSDIPALEVLLGEAAKAQALMDAADTAESGALENAPC